jgi:hypothetical protein
LSSHPLEDLASDLYIKKMISEKKIKDAFKQAKKDINFLNYNTSNNLRFLNVKVKEQAIRIRELERRISQVERLSFKEEIIR